MIINKLNVISFITSQKYLLKEFHVKCLCIYLLRIKEFVRPFDFCYF